MAKFSHAGIVVVIAGFGLLAGCEEGTNFGSIASRADTNQEAPVSGGEAAGTSVEQDIEMPDVFAADESGLWDGRPSLGGVWVAHPDVGDPERVIIRNSANGSYVIGALFRRERNNPGPRIQVSSDAAAELGMLAGQPAELEVVALRREQVEAPTPAPSAEPIVPPLQVADIPADAATDTATEGAGVEVAALTAETDAADVATEAPKKKGFLAGLFAPKTPTTQPLVSPTAPLTSGEIETASLEPVFVPGPEAGTDAIDPIFAASGGGVNAASPTVASAAATTAPRTPSALQQPYIQIGIFSVSENADNTAGDLRRAGLVPTVRAQEARGKQFWRVIVGPATNAEERRTILAQVRELGFEDSYYVSN
ncbi:MAG: SPOR domain-containing protein [Pseudomonadota bacterium]